MATYPMDKAGPLPNPESTDVITQRRRSYVIICLSYYNFVFSVKLCVKSVVTIVSVQSREECCSMAFWPFYGCVSCLSSHGQTDLSSLSLQAKILFS